MKEVSVPKVEITTDYEKINIATENAFDELIKVAKKLKLKINPVMGLMYLPSQETTRKFQEACRTVLEDLKK